MAVLPDSIYSPDHVRACIDELEHYAAILTKRARGGRSVLPELSPAAKALLAEMKGADASRADVITALAAELSRHLEAAPKVTLVVAAPPSRGLKRELVDWWRAETVREVMVEFEVNPDIAGGVVVRTASKLFDYSFRTKLLADPAAFTRILEHV